VSGNGLYRERGTEPERCASACSLLLGLRVRCALAEVCHAAFHFSGKRSAQMDGDGVLRWFTALAWRAKQGQAGCPAAVFGTAMRAPARHVLCALIAVFCDRAERYAWSVVERSVTVRNAGSEAAEWTTALSALLSLQGVGSGKSKG